MVVPKIQSAHNSEARNIINKAIETINLYGETIQDLVADGQLTPEQYSELILTVNSLVKSGHINKMDLSPEMRTELNELSRDLIEKAESVEVDALNKRIDDIITDPAEGITQQEIIDARHGETSLGENISKIKGALNFQIENEVTNGNFSDGTTDWTFPDPHFSFENGEFEIVDTGTYNIFLWQIGRPLKEGHKYYIYLNVENVDNNIEFYVRSGNVNTFGGSQSSNTVRGTNVLESVLTAAQDDDGIRIYTRRIDTALNSTFKINGLTLIDLTQSFGFGNEPSAEQMDAILGAQKHFEGLKILSQKQVMDYYEIPDTQNRIETLEQNTVEAKIGANLYNPVNNIIGEVSGRAEGSEQIIVDTGRGFVSQKIDIGDNREVVLSNIRIYSATDEDHIILKSATWVSVSETHSLTSSEIPSGTRYLWVSTYPDRNAQVELGDTLSPYKPYGVDGLYFNGEKILDLPIASGGGGDSDLLEYNLSQSTLQSASLDEELQMTKSKTADLYDVKNGEPQSSAEIELRDTSRQKLILHLHNRENDGYDTLNDVYLPNAADDFSDVQVKSESGDVLPYRVIYRTNDFDIVPDIRLGRRSNSYVSVDSTGRWINSHNRKISISEDAGVTWTPIPALSDFDRAGVTLVSDDDTIYFNKDGVLYRSPAPYEDYTEVLDTRENYTQTNILASSMLQHPDGELFAGAYQNEYVTRIYRSTDNGITWEQIVDEPDTYQHVHGMYIDTHQNPVAIYAGIDGGGGVLKTTDKGETWTDLRVENPDMPQSTDFGVVYADPSGYRLLGGETSIQGGYTLIKTTDDINFKPVLAAGNGVYNVRKLNGRLFAGGTGTNSFKSAAIYMSEDEGETWEEVYMTSPLNDTAGASDGFRYVSNVADEQIIVSAQSDSRSPLRILPEGNYAEIIVDVPEGSQKVTVESGYIYPKEKLVINDVEEDGEVVVNFSLNEDADIVKEDISEQLYRGNYEWGEGGKQLANFYPPIVSIEERNAIKVKSLNGFDVPSFDAREGMTISFWLKMGRNREIELIRTETDDTLSISEFRLVEGNGASALYLYPITLDTMDKIDIVIRPDGTMTAYANGQSRYTQDSVDFAGILNAITDSSTLSVLNAYSFEEEDVMQHFSIRRGVVDEAQLYQEYNAYITDNMGE